MHGPFRRLRRGRAGATQAWMRRWWWVMRYVAEGYAGALLRAAGVAIRPLGNRFRDVSAEAAADHHEQVWRVYRRFLDARWPRQACEVGPGDSLGMAILLAAGGAEEVTFVDRFPIRPGARDEGTRETLARRHGVSAPPTIHLASGQTAEDFFARTTAAFDFIGSNAVLEHLDRPIETLTQMYAALRPGGVMVHVVDLRPHGLFVAAGPLAWLETPVWAHRLITRHTARPNRVLFHAYRAWAEAPGRTVACYLRHVVGVAEPLGDVPGREWPAARWAAAIALVQAEQAKFAPELRAVAAADLAVTAFVLVAQKPAAEAGAGART